MPSTAAEPLDVSAATRLREIFDAAGFDRPDVLTSALGADVANTQVNRRQLPRYLRRLNPRDPLHTLIRVFLLGIPFSAEAFQAAIPQLSVEEWIAAGLLELINGELQPHVKLVQGEGLFVFVDRPPRDGRPPDPQWVMSIAASTTTLGQLTIRRKAGSALDMGCGCGIQAFLAASHCDRVTAVDYNPRAVGIARFNAAFNRLGNVDCRLSDRFTAVEGETFDLIVGNLPYVVSPKPTAFYRDGGEPGDGFSAGVVRAMPKYLNEGGFGQVMINWEVRSGEDWRRRLAEWTAGSGCDTWVLHFDTTRVDEYAATWVPDPSDGDERAFHRAFDEWCEHFAQQGVEAIGYGLLCMRKRTASGPNWFEIDAAPERGGHCGDAVGDGFRRRDFLRATDDAQLLQTRFRRSDALRWEQQAGPTDDGWGVAASRIFLASELAYKAEAEPRVVGLLELCRGDRTLQHALHDLAEALGEEPRPPTPQVLGVVREIVRKGFLVPT